MNVGSLFSGIGGLDLGLQRAGWQHSFLCESDEWRRGVLRERFPGVPVYDDVGDVGAHRVLSIDLLCGGFPCQDLSVAGRRRGLAGERSSLFFEFARIADALRPELLLVENVPGLLSSNSGRDFGILLGTLADIGYGVGWRTLDSRFFGVPQRRRRVFIVGVLAHGDPARAAERAGQILAVGQSCTRHPQTRPDPWQDAPVASLSGLGTGGPDDNDGQAGRVIAAPLSHGSNPNSNVAGRRREDDENLVLGWNWKTGGDFRPMFGNQAPALQKNQTIAAGVRRLTPVECERLQALPDNWTQVPHTAPDSRRYAALGDAVTVTVAEWIGRRLAAALEQIANRRFTGFGSGTRADMQKIARDALASQEQTRPDHPFEGRGHKCLRCGDARFVHPAASQEQT